MKHLYYNRIGESVYRETLPNGLQIYVVPRSGFAKKYAFFATRYGGMDTRFLLDGQWLDTPAGIAHYLEHKMFDTKEGRRDYERKRCKRGWKECPLAQALTRMWEDEP